MPSLQMFYGQGITLGHGQASMMVTNTKAVQLILILFFSSSLSHIAFGAAIL